MHASPVARYGFASDPSPEYGTERLRFEEATCDRCVERDTVDEFSVPTSRNSRASIGFRVSSHWRTASHQFAMTGTRGGTSIHREGPTL